MQSPVISQKTVHQDKKHHGAGELLFNTAGIFLFYLLYGYIQEYLMKEGRFGTAGEKFTFNAFLLIIQCLSNLFVAFIAIKFSQHKSLSDRVPTLAYAISATSQAAAMAFSFYALQFIDYPSQALAKSCKPIPVMVMGLLVFQKRYHWSKYITVIMITAGIAVFMKQQEIVSHQTGAEFSAFGLTMLLISLAMDGVTGPIQDHFVTNHDPPANQIMFHTNVWAALVSLAVSIVIGDFIPAIQFCTRNSDVWVYILGQSIASALGQLFIFRMIRSFGSLTLSIVTTCRKFFSILVSIVWFGHSLTTLQWTSVFAVFVGLGFDMIAPNNHGKNTAHHHPHNDQHDKSSTESVTPPPSPIKGHKNSTNNVHNGSTTEGHKAQKRRTTNT